MPQDNSIDNDSDSNAILSKLTVNVLNWTSQVADVTAASKEGKTAKVVIRMMHKLEATANEFGELLKELRQELHALTEYREFAKHVCLNEKVPPNNWRQGVALAGFCLNRLLSAEERLKAQVAKLEEEKRRLASSENQYIARFHLALQTVAELQSQLTSVALSFESKKRDCAEIAKARDYWKSQAKYFADSRDFWKDKYLSALGE